MDYTYPSVFLAYGLFFFFLFGGIYFFIRSFKDGYWGQRSEDVKYQIFDNEETKHVHSGAK